MKFLENEVELRQTEKKTFVWWGRVFCQLCTSLKPYLTKQTRQMQEPSSVEKQDGKFLYYICNEGIYWKRANAFGIAHVA